MPISQDKIAEHTRLLNALNALDYAPAAQEDNIARLTIVNREIEARQQNVLALEKRTKSEYKDLAKAKSPSRQFLLRLRSGGDAVNQRVEKEQKEYIDALRAERDARDELAMLMGEKREREAARTDLAEKVAQINDIKAKMTALYDGLFNGPTPDYPEEEEAERRYNMAEATYTRTQSDMNKCSTALTLLVRAEATIGTCISHVWEARDATANITVDDTLENVHSQLLQGTSLLAAKIATGIGQNLLRQADESSGCNVNHAVGSLDVVPGVPEYSQWNGREYARWVDPEFPNKLVECLQKLGVARTRLQGEIDKAYAHIEELENMLRQNTVQLQTTRKELADIRCQIMMRLTDPATLEARPRITLHNAHEVGDAELPMYFDSTNTAGRPTADPQGNVSIGVPSYEESQAQFKPVGGFRVEFPGDSGAGPAPTYISSVPAPAPAPAPAIGSGSVGGFRGATEAGPSSAPVLSKLKIPEPSKDTSSPTTPVIVAPSASPVPPRQSASSGIQHRSVAWSLNPYASAMIRQASMDDSSPLPPGGWKVETNPFLRMLSINEEPQSTVAEPSTVQAGV